MKPPVRFYPARTPGREPEFPDAHRGVLMLAFVAFSESLTSSSCGLPGFTATSGGLVFSLTTSWRSPGFGGAACDPPLVLNSRDNGFPKETVWDAFSSFWRCACRLTLFASGFSAIRSRVPFPEGSFTSARFLFCRTPRWPAPTLSHPGGGALNTVLIIRIAHGISKHRRSILPRAQNPP